LFESEKIAGFGLTESNIYDDLARIGRGFGGLLGICWMAGVHPQPKSMVFALFSALSFAAVSMFPAFPGLFAVRPAQAGA
jgi:hypothetical protein